MPKVDGNFSIKVKESILGIGVHILKGPKNLEGKSHTTRLVVPFYIDPKLGRLLYISDKRSVCENAFLYVLASGHCLSNHKNTSIWRKYLLAFKEIF